LLAIGSGVSGCGGSHNDITNIGGWSRDTAYYSYRTNQPGKNWGKPVPGTSPPRAVEPPGVTEAQGALAPMPVISFGVPAHASSGDARQANDRSYDTQWRSTEITSPSDPSWLAYDLSTVPPDLRGQVDVVWYNGNGTYNEYDTYAQAGGTYNQPRDYTIEGNAAPGGAVPTSGWVPLVTVAGNTYVSREHRVNLTGYNWIRIKVTAVNGSPFNFNTAINMDVHDASRGATDSWLFLGDSITAFAMRNDGAGIDARSFSELVNAARPAYYPAAQGAGEGGWNSGTALHAASPDGQGTLFDHWLSTFPGTYVCLSYGTNDGTDGSGDATGTYDNFVTMIKKVTAAGKIPCIPHVPWAQDEPHQKNAQLINAKIDEIYREYPQVVKGPDLYSILANQANLYQDGLHPNPQGREAYRQAWAKAMLGAVYPAQ
jgi:lysophospholipase L1-like esterase